jgi:hypothetical protein
MQPATGVMYVLSVITRMQPARELGKRPTNACFEDFKLEPHIQ